MKLRSIALIFLSFLLLSSCGTKPDNMEMTSDFIYNGVSTDWITSDENYIYSRTGTPAHMINLQTEQKYDFMRDPFFTENEQASQIIYIFSDEKNVYYLFTNDRSKYQIIRRDNETLSEEVVYEKVFYRKQRELLLGAVKSPSPGMGTANLSDIPNRFAIFENTLFLFGNDSIEAVNIKAGKEFTVFEDSIYNGNYSYYKGKMYFVSSAYDIYSYQIQNKELERINGFKAQSLTVTPNGIYFSAANDEGKLHFIDFNGKNEKVFPNKSVTAMDFNGEDLYFLSEGDNGIYHMNLNNSEIQKIFDLHGAFDIYCVKGKNVNIVLYTDSDGNFAAQKIWNP